MEARHKRKEQIGTVISDAMDKTVVVVTTSHVKHPRYGKFYSRKAKFPAHDEKQISKTGDVVRIQETRPLSKTKNWKVIEVVRSAKLRSDEIIKGEEVPLANVKSEGEQS